MALRPSSPTPAEEFYFQSGSVFEDSGRSDAAEDGDTVLSVTDSSGSGNHMTSGAGAAYEATGGPGSVGCLHFNGSSHYFNRANSGEPKFVIAVVKPDTLTGHQTVLGADTSDSVDVGAYYFKTAENTGKARFSRCTSSDSVSDGDLGCSVDPGPSTSVWSVIWGTLDTSATKTISFGKMQGSATIHATASDTSTQTLRPITQPVMGCGWYSNSRVDFYDGKIACVITFTTTPTTSELCQWVYYLWRKYGLGLPEASTVNYAMSNFNSADETLRMLESEDGTTWYLRPVFYTPNGGAKVRDPSIFKDANGVWWLAHTNTTLGSASTTFDVATSTDSGLTWTYVASVDCSGAKSGVNRTWAPEWFVDGDGTVYVNLTISNDAEATLEGFWTKPTNAGYTTWASLTALAGVPTGSYCLDWWQVRRGSTYYLWFRQSSGGNDYIIIYTASSVHGTYSSHRTGNWASFGSATYEGPCVFQKADLTWIDYMDHFGGGGLGIYYTQQASGDWTGGGSSTWNAPLPITIANATYTAGHGTILFLGTYPLEFPPGYPRKRTKQLTRKGKLRKRRH